jgi:hypothetical protein
VAYAPISGSGLGPESVELIDENGIFTAIQTAILTVGADPAAQSLRSALDAWRADPEGQALSENVNEIFSGKVEITLSIGLPLPKLGGTYGRRSPWCARTGSRSATTGAINCRASSRRR